MTIRCFPTCCLNVESSPDSGHETARMVGEDLEMAFSMTPGGRSGIPDVSDSEGNMGPLRSPMGKSVCSSTS